MIWLAPETDAIQRDERHRQRLDSRHAGVIEKKESQSCPDGHHKICEPDDVENEISGAVLRQHYNEQCENTCDEVAPPCIPDERLGKQVVLAIPEEDECRRNAPDV